MKHPSWDELSAYVDNALDTHRWAGVARHVKDCRECSDQIADLSAEARALRRTLEQDPGDAYFANFSAGVDARIDAEITSKTRAPRSITRGWAKWWETPQGLTLVGTAAAVVAAAGVVLMLGRGPRNVLTDATTLERSQASAPSEEPPATDALSDTDAGLGAEAKREKAATGGLAAGGARNAEPSRAYEVRRSANGEDERVQVRGGRSNETSLEAGGADLKEGEAVTAPKQRAAEPLGTQTLSSTKKLAAPAPMAADAARQDRARDASADVRVCGEVRDTFGQPLRFATITLRARNVSVASDDKGRFCLYAAPGSDSVIVTLSGYQPLRRAVTLRHDMADQVVSLQPVTVGFTSNRSGAASVAQRELAKTADQASALVALPDSIQKIADYAVRLSSAASRSKDARQYEAAAEQWQRLLRHVQGSPLENETRGNLAEARYRAWEAEPTARRMQAAREALTAYLVRAPIGPERNRATLWLDQVAK